MYIITSSIHCTVYMGRHRPKYETKYFTVWQRSLTSEAGFLNTKCKIILMGNPCTGPCLNFSLIPLALEV